MNSSALLVGAPVRWWSRGPKGRRLRHGTIERFGTKETVHEGLVMVRAGLTLFAVPRKALMNDSKSEEIEDDAGPIG